MNIISRRKQLKWLSIVLLLVALTRIAMMRACFTSCETLCYDYSGPGKSSELVMAEKDQAITQLYAANILRVIALKKTLQ